MRKAETGPSPMWKQIQREEARKATAEPAPAPAPAAPAAAE
jgi:small subunit ribosomal protein S6